MIEAAVIGVGQTKYEAKRRDVSMGGLVRKAIDKAMLAADVDWDAIDAVSYTHLTLPTISDV